MTDHLSPQLMTVGDLSRETGFRKHQIAYALDEYQIEPVQRAGIIRLFSRAQVPLIRSALRRIAARRMEAASA